MQQFDLEEWLKDKSRKIMSRRGNPVRIICWDREHGEDDLPIVFLEESNGGELLLTCKSNGRDGIFDTPYDLFFADEEEPKKALRMNKEEALQQYEYEKQLFEQWGGTSIITFKEWLEIKSIVLADEKDKLTEFEKAVKQVMWTAYNYDDCSNGKDVDDISNVKATSKSLLDLARKEILKDLPKFKVAKEDINYRLLPVYYCEKDSVLLGEPKKGCYYLELNDLKTLPKEE